MRAADTSRQPEKASNHVPAPPAARREEPPRRDSAAPWGQSDARLARSGLALRRLRYFHDLLTSAFTASQSADLTSGTLRTERIALAIDRPELDAVALWTARRDDGAVAIPFVEYLLGQFIGALETFLADLADPGAAAEVATLSAALEVALQEANRRGEQALKVPQLGDSFLPGALLERLCGREGLLERTVTLCQDLLGEAR
jgi:hypothetical protein